MKNSPALLYSWVTYSAMALVVLGEERHACSCAAGVVHMVVEVFGQARGSWALLTTPALRRRLLLLLFLFGSAECAVQLGTRVGDPPESSSIILFS